MQATPASRAWRSLPWLDLVWLAGAVSLCGLIIYRMDGTLLAQGESYPLQRGMLFWQEISEPDFAQDLHAPLHSFWMWVWTGILEGLSIEPSVLLIRLPGLLPGLAVVWTLVRLGDAIGRPLAGRAAGLLFLGLPLTSQLIVTQQNYLFEVLGAALIMLHVIRYADAGILRPVWFAAAAAFAVASGYMNLMVLGWGGLVMLVVSGFRSELGRMLKLLVVTGLVCLPFMWKGLVAAVHHFILSNGDLFPELTNELAVELRHLPTPTEEGLGGPLTALSEVGYHLIGMERTLTPFVLVIGACVLLLLRNRGALLALSVAVTTALSGQLVHLLLQNYSICLAPILFGLAAATTPSRRAGPRYAASGALLAWEAAVIAVVLGFATWTTTHVDTQMDRWNLLIGADATGLRQSLAAHADARVVVFGSRNMDVPLTEVCPKEHGVYVWVKCAIGSTNRPEGVPASCGTGLEFGRDIIACVLDSESRHGYGERISSAIQQGQREHSPNTRGVLALLAEAATAIDPECVGCQREMDGNLKWLAATCDELDGGPYRLWACP